MAALRVEVLGCTQCLCLYAFSTACRADFFILSAWCLQIEMSDDMMQAEVLILNLLKGQVLWEETTGCIIQKDERLSTDPLLGRVPVLNSFAVSGIAHPAVWWTKF